MYDIINTIDFLKDDIYFSLVLGSICSIIVLIFGKNKSIFNIHNESGFLKILFMGFIIVIMAFFLGIMAFEIQTTRQGILVGFALVGFLSDNQLTTNFLNERNLK